MQNDPVSIPMDIFLEEPADVYHARSSEFLSSHQLIDFMKCPLLYHKKRSGLIEDKDSPAYLLGRAAHVRILEGRGEYEKQFALGGPINPTTGKPYGSATKKFAEWQAKQGRPVLSFEQMAVIEQMASGISLNDEAVDLISYGLAEGVVRAEYCGLPCQIRLDWVNPQRGIVDLKTCDDLTWFEADARRFSYHRQMAFYQAVLKEVLGEYVQVHIIGIEKREPYRAGVWQVSEDCLRQARQENEAAIGRLRECQKLGLWPRRRNGDYRVQIL
ncbi:MAG: PD-(D/E)XK nuclease-like domain-containing protein [Anaerohalosphaeraceae bacterium]|jgi:hypothetical protein